MKKKISLVIVLALMLSVVFAGCGKKEKTDDANQAASVKTGVGVVISQNSTKAPTAEKNGTAQTDATIAAVTVDAAGKIVACSIDCAQTKIEYTASGALATAKDAQFQTKRELGDNYGMKAYAGAKYEWYEQANAFAAYCVGKTAEEVKAIKIESGHIDSSVDIAASVTITATDFVEAVVKACANAQDLGATATDKLSLGVVTNCSTSTDATSEKAGSMVAYSTIAVLTTAADGKISSAVIESYQSKIAVSATGEFTLDQNPQTKTELKENYGMKANAGAKYEWYEQAANYAKYITGKDLAGVNAIAIDGGHATDADLSAGCTIGITDFQSAVVKAFNNAK